MLAEKRLRCRTNAQALLKLLAAALSNPGNLGRKAFDMFFFLIKQRFRDEHRHIYIAMPRFFKHPVKYRLDVFPDSVSVGADDHASFNTGIIYEVGLFHNVGVPLRKVLLHRSYFFDGSFSLLCHSFFSFLL
ncbi:hypothetical protein SDC9_138949 [bioreactor metagenome]|uniref:Uncharacterized protein n=1 Tax=bioreactor metagenome TaxID=1076179 RepID=A0A645DRC2_9ZZZZ